MKKKLSTIALVAIITLIPMNNAFAQLGIRAGVNMAKEIRSFNNENISTAFDSKNLTGYTVGLVYQFNPLRSGLGFEVGALLSQKGGVFEFNEKDIKNSIVEGYREINYIDVPLNLRYTFFSGNTLSVFGTGGLFGSYALNGKTVFEKGAYDGLKETESFDDFASRIDYGYSLGAGIELIRKIQIAATWNVGLQKKDANKGFLDKINSGSSELIPNLTSKTNSKVFTVSLTYLF